MTKFFATLVIVGALSIASPVYAQATPTQVLQEAEIEREKILTQELKLSMPEQTEDPSYPVTFVDPSKKGVDITVDGKTITKAPSPYILPNLSIGTHTIAFSFKNVNGEPRYLQKTLLITPKPPVFEQSLKTRVVRPNAVVLQGTALPQSTVLIVINSNFTHTITSSSEGKWEFIVPEPQGGENNVITFTVRNGIVSNPSKVFTFEYLFQDETSPNNTAQENPADSITEFFSAIVNNIDANRKENPTLFYGIIGVGALIIILMTEISLRKKAAKRRDEKTIESLFSTHNKGPESIIDVIKTDRKGKKSDMPPVPDSKVGVMKAFDSLKKEMVEKDIYDAEAVQSQQPKTEKKGGFFSLFKRTPKSANIPVPDAPPTPTKKKEVEKEPPKAVPPKAEEPAKEEKTTVIEIKKTDIPVPVETKTEPPKEAVPTPTPVSEKKEKSTAPAPVVEKPEVVVTKQEEEVSDETEEPEKKVLTKEEFLKQFKKADED